MHSAMSNHRFCKNCTFAPFCLAEEKNPRCERRINPAVKQYRTLKPNEVLCLPKNKFQNLYAIQRGALKTYQAEANGKELIRGFYFAGEILGYETIYTGHYLFSAVALCETVICEIPYDNFLELLHANSTLQKHILYSISRQMNIGSYLVSSMAEQRVAAFLMDLSARLHPSETRLEFLLPISRQDIGNYLRLTTETISRVFSRLQKKKIIAIDHYRKIRFLQPEKLKFIADGLSTN